MRYILFVSLLLFLYSCADDTASSYNDVFFYPCECNNSPIDNGYIRVYKNLGTSGNLGSIVESVQLDSEYAINDVSNGLYFSYHISLVADAYYVEVHSDVTGKSQVHEINVKNGSNSFTLAACN